MGDMTDDELLGALVAVRKYLGVAQKAIYDPFDEARVLYAKMRGVEDAVRKLLRERVKEKSDR